jgi:enoyl-[acyl-carrier protein] reductase II
LKNHFYNQVQAAEDRGASKEELVQLLGRARAKKGMFEGDLEEGELEIGQVSALLDDILPASVITQNIWKEFKETLSQPLGF